MVLNEPETSLHPDLLPALARLLVAATARSQTLVVTHSQALVELLGRAAADGGVDLGPIELSKDDYGRTVVGDQDGPLDTPLWQWPRR